MQIHGPGSSSNETCWLLFSPMPATLLHKIDFMDTKAALITAMVQILKREIEGF